MKSIVYAVCFLFLFSCHSDHKLVITSVDLELDYPPVSKMKYCVISSYSHLSDDDLLNMLEDYVQKNSPENEFKKYDSYTVSFYKKRFGVDYRKYVVEKRYHQDEFPAIAEQRQNSIALIDYYKLNDREDAWEYSRILYDNSLKEVKQVSVRKDTVWSSQNTAPAPIHPR